jgi:hypothetical protein
MGFEVKNITSDASSVIANIAVDRVSDVDYPVSQLIVGADNGSKTLVTGSTGLPVDLVAGSALTSLQLIDDVVYADDADWSDGSSKHALVGGLYQSSPQSITDGDVGPVQVTANGYLIAALSPTDNAVLDVIAEAVHAEDVAVQSGDKGMLALVQRKDTPSANAGTNADADYTFLRVGNKGALWVQGINTVDVKFAVIDDASSGDNTIVAGVTDKKIRVLSYTLVSSGTVTARFESGASGTAKTGQMNLVANSVVSAASSDGLFETAASALLNLELSSGVSVDGHLSYIEV